MQKKITDFSVCEFIEHFHHRIPSDYSITLDGLFHHGKDRKGESQSKQLTFAPIAVIGIEVECNGINPAIVFAGQSITNKIATVRVPLHEIGNRGGCSKRLYNAGILVAPNCENDIFRFVAHSRQLLNKTTYYSTKTGWIYIEGKLTGFVLPEHSISTDEKSEIYFFNDAVGMKAEYAQSGTLEEWKCNVAEKIAKNPLPVFGLLVSLSGPVMHLANSEGFIVHLWGRSSSGKTMALNTAASIWGKGINGKDGFVSDWRTSTNAIEGLLSSRNETCGIMDELHMYNGTLSDAIYFMTQGKGKSAMKVDRSLLETYRWSLCVLSGGELSIESTMQIRGEKILDGQKVRSFDMRVTPETLVRDPLGLEPAEYVNMIKENAIKYYGMAGPAFVKAMLKDLQEDKDEVVGIFEFFRNECRELLLKDEPAGNTLIDRVVNKFSIPYITGIFACQYGILPYSADDIRNAVKYCFNLWRHNIRLESDDLQDNRKCLQKFISSVLRMQPYFFDDGVQSNAFYHDKIKAVCIPAAEIHRLFPSKPARDFLIINLKKNKELHQQTGKDGQQRNVFRMKRTVNNPEGITCYCVYAANEGVL